MRGLRAAARASDDSPRAAADTADRAAPLAVCARHWRPAGPVTSRTRSAFLGGPHQLFTPDKLLVPLLGKLDPERAAALLEQKTPPKMAPLPPLPDEPSTPPSKPPPSSLAEAPLTC